MVKSISELEELAGTITSKKAPVWTQRIRLVEEILKRGYNETRN